MADGPVVVAAPPFFQQACPQPRRAASSPGTALHLTSCHMHSKRFWERGCGGVLDRGAVQRSEAQHAEVGQGATVDERGRGALRRKRVQSQRCTLRSSWRRRWPKRQRVAFSCGRQKQSLLGREEEQRRRNPQGRLPAGKDWMRGHTGSEAQVWWQEAWRGQANAELTRRRRC